MLTDEKLLRKLLERKAKLEVEVFTLPPKSMDEFAKRQGAWQELRTIIDIMVEDAKGIEKD